MLTRPSNIDMLENIVVNGSKYGSECPSIDSNGNMMTNMSCESVLPSICVLKHCHRRTRDCCPLTREEAWQWERRVQGRSIVLRPGVPHVRVANETRLDISWVIVWVIFGGTIISLIGVRYYNQYTQERRYEEYNSNREKH